MNIIEQEEEKKDCSSLWVLLLCVSGMYFIIAFVLHAQTFSIFSL